MMRQEESFMTIRLTGPEFVDGSVKVVPGEGNVFEAAAEGIVVADVGPVDAEGGIDGRFDVLGLDVAAARPAWVEGGGAGVVGGADRAAAFDACAGESDRHLQPVIAAAGRSDLADRATELAHHDDQRTVELAAGFEVGEQRSNAVVKLFTHGLE